MSVWNKRCVFAGILSFTMTCAFAYYLFDKKYSFMKLDSNTEEKQGTFATINDCVTMAKNSSHEDNVQKAPLNHKCFHLNWNESALTQDVYSKCGFITFKRYLGRTGNQMFEVAALLGTAHDLDLIPIVSPSCPLLKYYNLPNVIDMTLTNTRECVPEKGSTIYTDCSLTRTYDITNVTIGGYRQSWKYFKNIEDSLAKIFRNQFKSDYLLQAVTFIKEVSNTSYKNVGIHIRRTDMLAKLKLKGRENADISYLHKAISYFKIFYERVQCIVISDDMKWSKTHLQSDDIIYSPFKNPGHDLALMSLCDHMIITTGSFGWWGSWLANGTSVFFREKINALPISDYYTEGSIGIR